MPSGGAGTDERERSELADKAVQQQAANTLVRELDAALRPKPYLAFEKHPARATLRIPLGKNPNSDN